MGALVRNHARGGGVDLTHVITRRYDGLGARDRIGINFTEVGFGPRAAVTLYDRGHSATAGIAPGEIDWKKLFVEQGVRWFHTGGIYAALSPDTRAVVMEAVLAAKAAGTIVSYDLNYRSALWSTADEKAVTSPLVPYIDCLFGNEEDFQRVLGYHVEDVDVERGALNTQAFEAMVSRLVADFPNLKVVGTTLRSVKSAGVNDWSGIVWADGAFHRGTPMPALEIEDRVGGGDGFASGLAWGFLSGHTPQQCVNLGLAHGALLMTTRGDTSMITKDELLHVASGGSARIKR
jgi:2-dehydro-3-deoxygluconokinase